MTMKKCNKCNVEKDLIDFYKDNKCHDGLRQSCKLCLKARVKEYNKNNKEKISKYRKKYGKQYYESNKEQVRAQHREHYRNNKDKKSEYGKKNKARRLAWQKEYYRNNRDKVLEYKRKHDKEWLINNRDHRIEYHKEYYRNNKDKIKKRCKEYRRNRLRTDINYKLAGALRSRVNWALKNNQKAGSAVRDLGCSIEELKGYLEAKFYPNSETGEMMAWDNWSLHGWHIDHIIPLASFDLTDREQFVKACHYTNLQPLWAKENIIKSDKLISQQE